jgi:hypothetical protein
MEFLCSPRGWWLGNLLGNQSHRVTKLFQTLDMMALESCGIKFVEIIVPQISIGLSAMEHMIDDDQHTGGNILDQDLGGLPQS